MYLYGIKIQANIKQNSVEKYAIKSQIFENIFVLNFFLTEPDPAQSFWAGPDLSDPGSSGAALHCSLAEQWRWGAKEEEEERREGQGKIDWATPPGGAAGGRGEEEQQWFAERNGGSCCSLMGVLPLFLLP